jgi:transcription initiation factor TFIID subunit TAF12
VHQPQHQQHQQHQQQQQQQQQQHQQHYYNYGMAANSPTTATYTAADHYQQQQHAVIAPTITPPTSRSTPLSYYNAAATPTAAAYAPASPSSSSVPTAFYHNPYSAYAANHAWENSHTNTNKTVADAAMPNQYQSGR